MRKHNSEKFLQVPQNTLLDQGTTKQLKGSTGTAEPMEVTQTEDILDNSPKLTPQQLLLYYLIRGCSPEQHGGHNHQRATGQELFERVYVPIADQIPNPPSI